MNKYRSHRRVKDSLTSITQRLIKLSRATSDKATQEVLKNVSATLVSLIVLRK